MTSVIIIAVLGAALAHLNRAKSFSWFSDSLESVAKASDDDLWQAFEKAVQSTPAKNDDEVRLQDSKTEILGETRVSRTVADSTVGDMSEGTIAFVSASALLIDEFDNLWLLRNASLHPNQQEGRIAVSRQPEGWFTQMSVSPSGRLEGEDVIRVVGHFEFR